MAIYIRAEWTIKHYIYELGAYIMWTGPYILMASSSITILLSFLGCWGTIHENPFLLSVVRIELSRRLCVDSFLFDILSMHLDLCLDLCLDLFLLLSL